MSKQSSGSGNAQENDLFHQAMGDVKPLKREARVSLKNDRESEAALKARRQAAAAEARVDRNFLSGGEGLDAIETVDPLAVLEFKRPGIQHGVYRSLRLGKYAIEARLDLHRMTVEVARRAVYQFINDCVEHDIRCALITHGKGENRQPQPALLKSCVAHWLPQFDVVQAFHSAQPQHGGTGATYVMLRKSERKRQENLERHQKRRG